MQRLLNIIRTSALLPLILTVGLFSILWSFSQYPTADTFTRSYMVFYGVAFVGSLVLGRMYSRCGWFGQKYVVRILGVLAVIYACCIVWTAYISFLNYGDYIDLSYFHSFLMQASQFHLPLVWDTGVAVWSQHVSPFLLLFVPLYWLGAQAGTLVFFQALLGVAAIVPLYLFTERLTKSSLVGVCCILAYLLSGGVQSSIYYGFHEVTFFPLVFFSVCWAWVSKRYRLFVLFLILMVFVKEEIAFIAIAFGLFLVCLRQPKYGWTSIAVGVLWYAAAFSFIGHFHTGGYEYWGQFMGGTGGFFGIVTSPFLHPLPFLQTLVDDERKLLMLIESFGSFGFLPIILPSAWILLVPPLMMKLLSSDITMMNSFHYSVTLVGVMVVSSVFAFAYAIRTTHRSWIAWFLLCMSLCGNIGYGMYFQYSTNAKMTAHEIRAENFRIQPEAKKRTEFLRIIPDDVSVNCQYQVCSHINRGYGKLLPIPSSTTLEYMVLDSALPIPLTTDAQIQMFWNQYVIGKYGVVSEDGTRVLLKRLP